MSRPIDPQSEDERIDARIGQALADWVGAARPLLAPPADIRSRGTGRSKRKSAAAALTSVAAAAALLAAVLVLPSGSTHGRHARLASGRPLIELVSRLHHLTPPDSSRQAAAASAAENAFVVSLTKAELAASPGRNLVYAPASLAEALTELELGAKGQTAAQLASALGQHGVGPVTQAEEWNALDASIRAVTQRSGIALANHGGILLNTTAAVRSSYLNVLASQFDDGVWRADFSGDAAGVAAGIDHWAATAGSPTGGPQAGSLGHVTSHTELLLAIASGLTAPWADSVGFLPSATRKAAFHLASGKSVTVPTMHLGAKLRASTSGGITAVALPYGTGNLSAIVVAPTSGSVVGMLDHWGPGTLATIVSHLETMPVKLSLPKLSLVSQTDFRRPLEALGVSRAFSVSSNFGAMTPSRVSLAGVSQRSGLLLNESGTNLTSRTAPVGHLDYGATTPAKFDRPFALFVRDDTTGAVLFEAVIMNPAAS